MFHIKKKHTEWTSISLNALVWNRFKKNKLAMGSLGIIFFFILIAILGYLLTPDSTPFCNQQYLELTTLKPGTKISFLQVTENKEYVKTSGLKKMLYGRELSCRAFPLHTYQFKSDSVSIESYTGATPNNGDTMTFALADICFPLDIQFSPVVEKESVILKKINTSQTDTIAISVLQKMVQENHLLTKKFVLGTDKYGRDVLSQIMIGSRVSLSVGFIAVIISLLIGIFAGAIAGYLGGWVDSLVVWFINVIWSIPTILLVIAITFALGKGFWQVFVAVGLTMWVDVARIVRGQVLSIKEKEYVEASKALGYRPIRIIFKHILPNIMGAVIVITASNFASAILLEAGLSFLGIGVQPPMPSWGMMIKENYPYLILDAAYLAFLPGIATMLIVLAFMLTGNGLRSALDIKE